jgi:hypothetical protein
MYYLILMPATGLEFCVMYGRPLFGKGFYEVSAIGSGAVMYPACLRGFPTAGHEGIRGSGSYHSGALEAR